MAYRRQQCLKPTERNTTAAQSHRPRSRSTCGILGERPSTRDAGGCNAYLSATKPHRTGSSAPHGPIRSAIDDECQVGDLAHPTEHRTPRNNDDRRCHGRSAEWHTYGYGFVPVEKHGSCWDRAHRSTSSGPLRGLRRDVVGARCRWLRAAPTGSTGGSPTGHCQSESCTTS